ncbi:MAG: low molecular weight protein-tyrosine-phosphatase [Erysipelotrichaceae bacterium]|nr:low molecular weight protein-tyrosine-phosphatase [Erysipelotrichaceae bacterium]
MKKVLFVCHGNICRSPMAEYLFKYMTKDLDYYCESRAVSLEEIGNDMHPKSQRTLTAHGIPYGSHSAKRITEEDYREYDVIFVMDDYNLSYINRLLKDDDHKIRKLCKRDVADPWYTGDYEQAYQDIKRGIEDFLKMD